MLRDDNHPYYQLAERAWTQVDNRYIEHFCLNIGYESWTRGAATIRSLEAELNCNIPWLLTIIRSAPTGAPLAEEAIRALMEQGMRMGIYAYLLVDCQLDTALIHRLSADYATCALSVVSMDSRLTNETLTMLDVDYQQDEPMDLTDLVDAMSKGTDDLVIRLFKAMPDECIDIMTEMIFQQQ